MECTKVKQETLSTPIILKEMYSKEIKDTMTKQLIHVETEHQSNQILTILQILLILIPALALDLAQLLTHPTRMLSHL